MDFLEEIEIGRIRNYAAFRRKKEGITPTGRSGMEPSGEAFGVGYCLLYHQLIPNGVGWEVLGDPGIRKLVIKKIYRDRDYLEFITRPPDKNA